MGKSLSLKLFTIAGGIVFTILSMRSQAQDNRHRDDLLRQLSAIKSDVDKAATYRELGKLYLTKPGELKSDLDSAEYFQRLALALSDKLGDKESVVKAILLGANIQAERGDVGKAKEQIKAALDIAQKEKLFAEEGKCYEAQTVFYNNENDGLAAKIELEKKAIVLFQKAGAKEYEATGLKFLGDYCHLRGKVQEALGYLLRSIQIYDAIHFRDMQGVYNIVSNVYTQLGNFPESIRYGLLAAQVAERIGDRGLELSSIYNHLALTYYFLNQNDEALKNWEKSLEIARKYNDAGYLQTILSNMATVYVRLKKYDNALSTLREIETKYPPTETQMKLRIPYIYFNTYMDMGKVNIVKPYYDTLQNYHKRLPPDDANQIYLFSSIIRYMIATKQYENAYPYIQQYSKTVASMGNYLFMSRNELQWFKADSATGKFQSAITHYKQYKQFSDSVFNKDKANQIAILQVQFETTQKDNNIRHLTQENTLQAETIHKAEIIKEVIAGCAVLLLLLLALIYNRFRLKQRSNRQLQKQQLEINEQYETVRKVLKEKEWLLREIHHRVKNNLQIVISLLNTQSAYIDNADAMEAIQNSQHRMHAMSLIHQKLYQSDNLAEIDMAWYIHELVSYMKECFDIERITFQISTAPLSFDVAQAVPLGLILNEAVTNAIKYAFPAGRRGTIRILLKEQQDRQYLLAIADDGIGMPPELEFMEHKSLGMNLMQGLTGQLDGEFILINEHGLCISIRFPVNPDLVFSRAS